MGSMIRQFCHEIKIRTGWALMFLGGGPDPREQGAITTMAVHSSQDKFGLSFGQANTNFEELYVKPFGAYLEQLYREFMFCKIN